MTGGRILANDAVAAALLAERGYEIVDADPDVVVGPAMVDGDAPVVLVAESAAEAVAAGAFDVIRPPLDADELVARVGAALRYRAAVAAVGEAVRTDSLTGLGNRRHIDEHLRMSASLSRRHHRPLSIAIVDVDHLRRVNDTYGFAAGDEVIKAVASRIAHVLRTEDMAGRWGGEEFLALLPSTDLDGAWTLAERIRDGVSSSPVALDDAGLDVLVTVSVGCAEGAGDDLDDQVRRALAALDHAKESGRNRVVLDTTVVA